MPVILPVLPDLGGLQGHTLTQLAADVPHRGEAASAKEKDREWCLRNDRRRTLRRAYRRRVGGHHAGGVGGRLVDLVKDRVEVDALVAEGCVAVSYAAKEEAVAHGCGGGRECTSPWDIEEWVVLPVRAILTGRQGIRSEYVAVNRQRVG